MSEKVLHAIVAVALVAAYAALTIAGHDGNVVLALLGGQGLGAGVSATAKATNGGA